MSAEEAEAAATAMDIAIDAEGPGKEGAEAAGDAAGAGAAAEASGDAAAAAGDDDAEDEDKDKKKKKKKKHKSSEKERKKHRRKREEEEGEGAEGAEGEGGAEGGEAVANGKDKEGEKDKDKERSSSRRDRSSSRDRGRDRRRRSRSRSRSPGRRDGGGGGGGGRSLRSPTPPREKERRHDRRRSRSRSRSRDRRSRRRSRSRSDSRDRRSRRRRRSSRSRSRDRDRDRDRDRKRRSRSDSSGDGEKGAGAGAEEPEEVLEPGVVDVGREASIKGPIPTIAELIKKDPSLGVVKALAKVEEEKKARVLNEEVKQQAQAWMQANLGGAQQAAAMGAGAHNPMPALTRPARELFVGNLPPGTLAPQLSAFVAAAMGQMGLLRAGPGNPCTNAWLSPDARFAFVEFRSVEEATAALALNNLPVGAGAGGGQQLRVGRPKEYQPSFLALKDTPLNAHSIVTAPPAPAAPATAAAVPGVPAVAGGAVAGGAVVLPTAALTSPYLMLMNLPTMLGELDVKELIKSFGTAKSFNLLKDKESGRSKGIAIFEYAERSEAQVALKGLQGLEIGGKKLAVQEIPTAQANMLLRPVAPTAIGDEGAGLSTVVRLRNMLAGGMDAEELGEIKDEVADECRKYGNLVEVVCGTPEAGLDIFVEFGDARASQRALRKLHGRSFDERSVEAAYYPLEAFKAGDYAQEDLGQGEDAPQPGAGAGEQGGEEEQGGQEEAAAEAAPEAEAEAPAPAPEGEEEGAVAEEPEPPAAAPPGPVVDEDLD